MLQNLIIGIPGMKGYGKSTYLKELVEGEESLVIVDTLGEHKEWCPECPGESIREQVEMLAEPPESFRWSFMLNPSDSESHLDYLCKAAYRAGGLTFVLEEADYFSSANRDCEGMELLIRYGRHRGINLVWLCRNVVEVSRRLSSQTDAFVMFRTAEPLYIEKLAKRLSPELALEIQSLPRFHYLICQPGQSTEVVRGVTRGTHGSQSTTEKKEERAEENCSRDTGES